MNIDKRIGILKRFLESENVTEFRKEKYEKELIMLNQLKYVNDEVENGGELNE